MWNKNNIITLSSGNSDVKNIVLDSPSNSWLLCSQNWVTVWLRNVLTPASCCRGVLWTWISCCQGVWSHGEQKTSNSRNYDFWGSRKIRQSTSCPERVISFIMWLRAKAWWELWLNGGRQFKNDLGSSANNNYTSKLTFVDVFDAATVPSACCCGEFSMEGQRGPRQGQRWCSGVFWGFNWCYYHRNWWFAAEFIFFHSVR